MSVSSSNNAWRRELGVCTGTHITPGVLSGTIEGCGFGVCDSFVVGWAGLLATARLYAALLAKMVKSTTTETAPYVWCQSQQILRDTRCGYLTRALKFMASKNSLMISASCFMLTLTRLIPAGSCVMHLYHSSHNGFSLGAFVVVHPFSI